MKIPAVLPKESLWTIFRFYQAALLNTIFGLSLYATLIYFGVNKYYAQVISHVIGMTFNYFTYSWHVFRVPGAKFRFLLSYIFSGLLNFTLLYCISFFVASPYIAGVAATLCGSIIMFFVLKYCVFHRDGEQGGV